MTPFKMFIASKGMTQLEVADYLGITFQSLSNKARGKTPWKWREVMKLKELFGQEIIDMLERNY